MPKKPSKDELRDITESYDPTERRQGMEYTKRKDEVLSTTITSHLSPPSRRVKPDKETDSNTDE